MKIYVRPRYYMQKIDLDVLYIVISISDPPPGGEPARIPQRWGLRGIVRVEFADVAPGNWPDPEQWYCTTMKEQHARIIWDFVEQYKSQVGTIVVHCDAGISRSPSVAMALADHYGWPRTDIYWIRNEGSPPNMHVYQTMMKARPK